MQRGKHSPRREFRASGGDAGKSTPVSRADSSHSRRASSGSPADGGAAHERRVAAQLLEAVGAEVAAAGQVAGGGGEGRQRAPLVGLGEEQVAQLMAPSATQLPVRPWRLVAA